MEALLASGSNPTSCDHDRELSSVGHRKLSMRAYKRCIWTNDMYIAEGRHGRFGHMP